MECGTWTLVGLAPDKRLVLPLACRRWTCPRCRRKHVRKLKQRLATAHVDSLITLTCAVRAYATPYDGFLALNEAVALLVKRLRRRYSKASIQYWLVWETTKKGWPHVHLLFRGPWVPKGWLSSVWRELAHSPIVDIRPVRNQQQVQDYLVKYLAKDPSVPSGFRRYRSSAAFYPSAGVNVGSPTSPFTTWYTRDETQLVVVSDFLAWGYVIEETRKASWLLTKPPPQPVILVDRPRVLRMAI